MVELAQFSTASEFFTWLMEAKFTFRYLLDFFMQLYYSVTQNGDMALVWNKLMELLTPVKVAIPYVMMAVGIVVCLFGKKLQAIIKFIGFFVIGFAAGVYFLEPIIPPEVPIPGWVVGLVVAIVAAVAYKFLFIGVYSVAVLYSVYRLCYYGFFLDKEPVFSMGKAITSLVVAAVVLTATLILFKYTEMTFFSLLGSWIAVTSLSSGVWDIGAFSWILELVIIIVIAAAGLVFQIKTRRRY